MSNQTEPDSMHGWRFDEPLDGWIQHVGTTKGNDTPRMFKQFKEYLIERCRRAESRLSQVTEDELRKLFEQSEEYKNGAHDIRFAGILFAARLFGMLKP